MAESSGGDDSPPCFFDLALHGVLFLKRLVAKIRSGYNKGGTKPDSFHEERTMDFWIWWLIGGLVAYGRVELDGEGDLSWGQRSFLIPLFMFMGLIGFLLAVIVTGIDIHERVCRRA